MSSSAERLDESFAMFGCGASIRRARRLALKFGDCAIVVKWRVCLSAFLIRRNKMARTAPASLALPHGVDLIPEGYSLPVWLDSVEKVGCCAG